MSTEIQVAVKKETSVIGLPLKRLEDPNFITGTGKYIDDIRLPNTLHASFARSLQAHAKIRSIDVSRAASHPSVRLVLTGKDMMNDVGKMQTVDNREEAKPTTRYALAVDEVNYAGEPIALIVAEDRYSAVDAAELVEVDFEPLPVVIDPEKALEKSSPKVHDYLHDNIGYHFKMESGNVEKVFEEADHVVKLELENQLVAPVPLEPRGILASYDFASEFLTLWLGTQTPYEAREELAKILRLSEANLRVIAPDVGGAFG
jgi:carbon-monoxide dehydrogenase large subunit